MNHYEVVTKLIGPIKPVGETHTDEKRLENLSAVARLVDGLLDDIEEVAADNEQPEHSIRLAGQRAHEFLDYVKWRIE